MKLFRVNCRDNVIVALSALLKGEELSVEDRGRPVKIILLDDIPKGHKVALSDIPVFSKIVKGGIMIGESTQHITRGEHIHVHNIKSQYL